MAMYEDDSKSTEEERLKYKTIVCAECGKLAGLYFRKNPTFFDELFFCTLLCHQKHLDKRKGK